MLYLVERIGNVDIGEHDEGYQASVIFADALHYATGATKTEACEKLAVILYRLSKECEDLVEEVLEIGSE